MAVQSRFHPALGSCRGYRPGCRRGSAGGLRSLGACPAFSHGRDSLVCAQEGELLLPASFPYKFSIPARQRLVKYGAAVLPRRMGPACRRRSGTPGRGGMESGRPARLQTCRPAQCGSRPTQWPASCVIRRPGWLPPGTHSRCQGATGWRGCQILRPRPTRRFQTTRCR